MMQSFCHGIFVYLLLVMSIPVVCMYMLYSFREDSPLAILAEVGLKCVSNFAIGAHM